MQFGKRVTHLIKRLAATASEQAEAVARDRHNLDIVLASALRKVGTSQPLSFPAAYVDLLRGCLEEKTQTIREVKADKGPTADGYTKRFSTLCDSLRFIPPVELRVAEDVALIADSYRQNQKPFEAERWAGDVALYFEFSSSFATKGRILSAIVRFMRSTQCLELGTAYGMSAVFILDALSKQDTPTHLTTIEAGESQFSHASEMLQKRYGDRVSCEFGLTQDVLPRLLKTLGPVDFLFHDAAHTLEAYVGDFQSVLPSLPAGSVALIDDIRWEDSRFSHGSTHCYEGWMQIVSHPRVRRAIEIDGSMGLALLGA